VIWRKLITYAIISLHLLVIIPSCASLFPRPAPVKLYWKVWLNEDYPGDPYGVLNQTYPIAYLYDEKNDILYIKGRFDMVAAVDLQNKKILWKKFKYFTNGDSGLYEYNNLIYTHIFSENAWFGIDVYIVGIDKETGEIKWKYMLEANGLGIGFTLKDGYIYAMDWDPEATSVSTEGILKKISCMGSKRFRTFKICKTCYR